MAYAGPARALVAAWKEHGLRRAAGIAADLVSDACPRPAADVITYIPPDPVRLLRRGHHPAERLAHELARRWEAEAVPLLLRAGDGSTRQADLPREARLRNVRDVFVAAAAPPRRLVLVDDVYTTGATASSAAGVLRAAGAERVDVVTFARTVRE